MKKYILEIVILLFVLPHIGCESITNPEKNLVVVKSFLYADNKVEGIQITSTFEVNSSRVNAPPINDADVSLYKGGHKYKLTHTADSDGVYHYPGNDLEVLPEDSFRIEVKYYGRTAAGGVKIPLAPQGLTISDTLLQNIRDVPDSLYSPYWGYTTVSWEPNYNMSYFIRIENIEESPDSILFYEGIMDTTFNIYTEFIYPGVDQIVLIPGFHFQFYGRYVLKLYSVNGINFDTVMNNEATINVTDQRSWNIENGIGIIAGFNCKEITFNVIKN